MRLIDADILVNDDRVCKGIACKECPFHYDDGCKRCDFIQNYPTAPAIPIPDNATNGDMIKALFADNFTIDEFALCADSLTIDEFKHDARGLIDEVHLRNGRDLLAQFDKDWWNAPYKRGKTE